VAFYLGLGKGAYQSVRKFPVLKEEQRRNALCGVLGCGHMVLIYVEFCNLNHARVFRGELFEDGRHHAAGAAPGCPAVYHYRVWTGEHLLIECTIRYHYGAIIESPGHERRATLGAHRPILQTVLWDPIFRAALGTWNNNAILIQCLTSLLMIPRVSRERYYRLGALTDA
jgi:hypothetical protein